MVGEPKARNHGVGTEATRAMVMRKHQMPKSNSLTAVERHTRRGTIRICGSTQKAQAIIKPKPGNLVLGPGQDNKTVEKLKQAGVSEQDIKRVMEALAKKDTKQLQQLAQQLQQQLQKQGMTQQQAQKLAQQLQKNQQACQQCNKLGQQMSKAAQAMQQGKQQQAGEQLGRRRAGQAVQSGEGGGRRARPRRAQGDGGCRGHSRRRECRRSHRAGVARAAAA